MQFLNGSSRNRIHVSTNYRPIPVSRMMAAGAQTGGLQPLYEVKPFELDRPTLFVEAALLAGTGGWGPTHEPRRNVARH